MSKSAFTPASDEFRALLKELREKRGLTQVQVAKRLGLPQSYVSKVETGERRMDFVETAAFCQAIEMDLVTFTILFTKRLEKSGEGAKNPGT